MLIRGKLKPADAVPYWIVQFLAAAVAALLTSKVLPRWSACNRNSA
jgi:glycerol uptake facilitator-like aquaporin